MKRIGVLTSGGDAQGMNAAVRAVVRTALDKGAEIFAIEEGYRGMCDGGERIRPLTWSDTGGILHRGGTDIGSARCKRFRTYEGRQKAALHLVQHGIDHLVVIGGDGSLTGAQKFAEEWAEHLKALVEAGLIGQPEADNHPYLYVAGLVGSIDNDMAGTDITIGADTALHRITEAVDAISSTAASHQRTFVVEVMGRRCGYLAMMSAIATGADWALIPESPPNLDEWEDKMCSVLRKGRRIGRRDSIVIVAEGAQNRKGEPITSDYVKQVLETRLGEDTRVTILGHVQRGGAPSAFDRNLSSILGSAAVAALLEAEVGREPFLVGLQGNQVVMPSLRECLDMTEEIRKAVNECDFEKAMSLRGSSFREAFMTLRTLVRALPHDPEPGQRRLRLMVMNAGAPSPGMNTAVRALVRLGLDKGHHMLAVYNGFSGFARGEIEDFDWMDVNGWVHTGGAELGTNRHIPQGTDFYAIARNLENYEIDGIIMVGGWNGYEGALAMHERRNTFPAFDLPIVCLPATIDNDLPGADLSVGADTALNSIVEAVDKIKQSAVASRRVFVVEVMGGYCGYLALMSALATGAERVYMHEEGVTLSDLEKDVANLVAGFRQGKRLGVVIRNEQANSTYSAGFISDLFTEEGEGVFDVRQAILGHIQQGGNPTPFDRILATRLAVRGINYIEEQVANGEAKGACIGMIKGGWRITDLQDVPRLMEMKFHRPKEQWWLQLRPIARVLAQAEPSHPMAALKVKGKSGGLGLGD
ncbi:MAG TPA: 6-phosphofructokinase [Anaerolineae bacterium]|nr:6-phosphofructokinase [Anaerolineae bacterium]